MQVRWTGVSEADLDAWVDALAVIEVFDRTGETLGRADLEDELALSYVDAGADVRLGWDGDRIVAWGTVVCVPNAHQRRVQITGSVVPDRRGQGIGTELVTWLIERGTEVANAQPTDAAAWLELGATAGDRRASRSSRRSGSHHSATTSRCVGRSPTSCRRPGPCPRRSGSCRTTSRTTRPRRAAHNEAFRDHFAAIEMDRETWARWVTGGQGFRADCSFLVFDGDDIAGYVLDAIHPDDWPGLGFTEGWTHQLGVRRPWRGVGVATVLLDLSAAAFAADGLDFATLDVDAENPTGALGLYESQGYHRDRTRVAWSLPVD